ncbi:MAG: GldG family protein [Anaerolineae bacterium]|nr:GldG family protein [Anaerolineae bacterium]NUQ02317.1 Gldg family protein [Anaerolineae bacterium]
MKRTDSASIIIRRRALGVLGNILGVAGVVIGVIGLIWTGAPGSTVIAAFVVGIGGILLWAVATPQEFAGFFSGRQVRFGTMAIISTILLIGIVALVYLQLLRAAWTFDATQATRYTLSPETERVLSRLSSPMRIIGFYSSRALTTREIDDQFFRLYETATNGLISREYIDPDEQPAIARRYGVQYDGQVFLANVRDDGTVDLATLARVPRGGAQERDITEAIARQLIAGRLTIYFDIGLGERGPLDATQEGVSAVFSGVQESGINARTLDLAQIAAQGGEIPADASAVLFIRPLRDLTDNEIQTVARYLEAGGALLLLTDVLFSEQPFLSERGAFNQFLLENYGIGALDAAVVDPGLSAQTLLDVISAYVFAESDIAARLDPAVNPTLFSVARAVDVKLSETPPNIATGRVIFTTEQAYGETNLTLLGETNTYQYDEGVDLPGPLTTAAWSTNIQTGAKIVLIGDGDFVANGRIVTTDGAVTVPGNGILFTDSVVWLTELSEEIDFQPQMYGQALPLIFVSQQQMDIIAFITVIFMPAAVLLIGIGIWMRRSRR